jgi:hypothetical protein
MSASWQENVWPPYKVRTHNPSAQSENRIHSHSVAQRYGFKGALVPGVVIFSHMTQPLVAHLGEQWLQRGIADVTFYKPAYEDEMLTVSASPASGAGDEPAYTVTCINDEEVELARMSTEVAETEVPPDPRAQIAPAPPSSERPVVTWELMETGKPFPALSWQPTRADNLQWCNEVRDELPLYREGPAPLLHPGLILRQANLALRSRFTLPAWIHTGSRITLHAALRAGERYEVRAIPEQKWIKKEHEFVRLYVAIRLGERTVAEVMHTAIFRLREVE